TSQIDGGVNPTYMAFAPNRRFAFAIDEANPPDSKVLSFAIDQSDGSLTPIADTQSGALGSPHLAVHPSGRWLVVAHYGNEAEEWTGGSTVSIPIGRDGTLGEAGPLNFGPENHHCVNAHQVVFGGLGNYVLVPCLGSDSIVQYRFEQGELSLN